MPRLTMHVGSIKMMSANNIIMDPLISELITAALFARPILLSASVSDPGLECEIKGWGDEAVDQNKHL